MKSANWRVDHALRVDRPVLARVDRPVEPVDDVLGELGRGLGDRRVVAADAAQHRDERRDRRDDPQRVAVRLHEQRVRVLGEQRVEAPDVAGRLEHPLVRRVARLQVLEEHAVPAVRGRHVGLVQQPVAVARHVVLRREDHRPEVGAGDAHALLREARAHRVHLPELGEHEVDHRELRVDLLDPRVGEVRRGLGRRQRLVDLPRERHACVRVLREEVVEDRRAGAALADDDDRRA